MRNRYRTLKIALMALVLGTLPAALTCDTYGGFADLVYDIYPGGYDYVYYDDYYYDDYYYDDYYYDDYYYEEDSWWW